MRMATPARLRTGSAATRQSSQHRETAASVPATRLYPADSLAMLQMPRKPDAVPTTAVQPATHSMRGRPLSRRTSLLLRRSRPSLSAKKTICRECLVSFKPLTCPTGPVLLFNPVERQNFVAIEAAAFFI